MPRFPPGSYRRIIFVVLAKAVQPVARRIEARVCLSDALQSRWHLIYARSQSKIMGDMSVYSTADDPPGDPALGGRERYNVTSQHR